MKKSDLPRAEKYIIKHKRHNIWKKIVSSLACVVVFITTYMLILPAITMEQNTFCGYEEHRHDESCYEQRLVCQEEETVPHVHDASCYQQEYELICGLEETPGHIHDGGCVQTEQVLVCTEEHGHTDACYAPEQVLICAEDHEHTEACYEVNWVLVCMEEHGHTDACYQTVESYVCGLAEGEGSHTHGPECYASYDVLVCGQEENENAHAHTEACYERVLTCEREEHTHSLPCYSDPNADIESEAVWRNSVSGVSLTGIWADDVIAIAQSQLGYTESTRNYIVTEENQIKGITRYGQWYGDPYGDWCAMFASFCLNYANVPLPLEASCSNWQYSLSDIYYGSGSYLPVKGDIVFFDNDGNGGADHVGLVAEAGEDSGLVTIEGNSSDCVQYVSYGMYDSRIMGYAALPVNPDTMEAEEDTEEIVDDTMIMEENDWLGGAETTDGATDETDGENGTGETEEQNSSEQLLNVNKNSVTGSVTYDKVKDIYTVSMTIDFTIDNSNPDTVSKTSYVYNYPEGYPVPEGLLNDPQTLRDSQGTYAGTYTFRQNADGTYSVVINISESYAKDSTTGTKITGYVTYKGTMDGTAENEAGNLVIGSGDNLIIIPASEITYPDGETHKYNVCSDKSGTYKVENNQLVYTVWVYSTKGTPGTIDFTDTITADGLTLGIPDVTVQEIQRTNYGSWQTDWIKGNEVSVSPSFSNENKTISMSLPQLNSPSDTVDNGKLEQGYLVTYTYDLSDAGEVNLTADNKVQVSSSVSGGGVTVTDEAETAVGIDRTHTFEKSGYYDRSKGTVEWTLTVNRNKTNIAGATISDKMFAQAVDEKITVTPDSGYVISGDTITFQGIDGASNNQTYTITYSTNVESNWDDQTITNHAVYDPTPGTPGDEITRDTGVSISGGGVEKAKVSETIAADRQSAEVEWQVTINVPVGGLPAGIVISDTADEKIWMTRNQVRDWAHVLYWKDLNGNNVSDASYTPAGTDIVFLASDGNNYTWEKISNDSEAGMDQLTYRLQSITLDDALIPPDGAAKLVFTYKTTVDISTAADGWNTYTNTVTINGKESSAYFSYESKTPTVSKTHGTITTKEEGTSKYVEIPWTVTVDVPECGWISGKTLSDDLTKSQWGNESAAHAISYQKALEMVTGAHWEKGTDLDLTDENSFTLIFVTKEGTEYTYQDLCQISDETSKSSLEFTGFSVTPKQTLLRPENETKIVLPVISRSEVSEVANGESRTYWNWAKIGSSDSSDQCVYTNRQNSVKKMDGNWKTADTTTASDGKLYWIVEVQLDNAVHNSVSITDVLPQHVTLSSIQAVAYSSEYNEKYNFALTIADGGSSSGNSNGDSYSGSYDSSNGTIHVTVKKSDDSTLDSVKFQFRIECLADDTIKDGISHVLKNEVTAKVDESEIGSSSQTQTWTYQEQSVTGNPVTKTGAWDNNARLLEYQVILNPDGKDYVPDLDAVLEVIDELTYDHKHNGYMLPDQNNNYTIWRGDEFHIQVNLLQSSVKLYYIKKDENGKLLKNADGTYQKGDEVTGWSWTYSDEILNEWQTKNKFTLTGIPDGTPLIMEYAYQVSSDLPEKAQADLKIQNTAKLFGQAEIGSSSQGAFKWSEQTSSGAVDSNRRVMKLIKVEQGHYENVLAGAEFSVYLATENTEDGELTWSESAVRTYKTEKTGQADNSACFEIEREEKGEDGTTVVYTYQYNTLYKVVETKAPDGYVLPETPTEYYFYFSDADSENNLPTNLPSGSMDLSKASYTVYAENAADSSSEETTQITVNKVWSNSGEETPEQIRVQLYQKAENSSSGDSGSSAGVSYTAFCNYSEKTGTFEGVSVGDTVAISVVYSWGAGGNLSHNWAWTGVSDGTGEWSQKDSNIYGNDTYTYTCKILSNAISFNTGDRDESIKEITCTVVSSGTGSTETGSAEDISYGDPITITSPEWSYTWENLPKTVTENGVTTNYTYFVKEEPVPGYSTAYTNNDGISSGTITITNSKDETEETTTSITLNKVWQKQDENGKWIANTDSLPSYISVYLKRSSDGGNTWEILDADPDDESNITTYAVTSDENGAWTLTVSDLPKADSNGNAFIYTFEEVQLPGYEPPEYEISADGKTVTITNKKIPTTSVSVEKKWETGMTEADVQVQLLRFESEEQPEENIGDSDSGTASTATTMILRSDTVNLPTTETSWWFYDIDKFTEFIDAQDGYFSVFSNNNAIKLIFQGNATTDWKGAEISATDVSSAADGTYISTFNRSDCMDGIKNAGMDLNVWNKLFLCADPASNTTVTKVEWTTIMSSDVSESTVESVPDGGKYIGEAVTLSSSSGWSYSWDRLPLYGYETVTENGQQIQKKVYYTYYVQEMTSEYSPTYSEEKPLTGGTLVITNHPGGGGETPEYTLPNTGGPGTRLYTLGGLFLALSAGGFLLYNHFRRRKEDRISS